MNKKLYKLLQRPKAAQAGRCKRGSSYEQDYIYYLASVTLLHLFMLLSALAGESL